MGLIIAVRPIIESIFIMLLPRILPKARSVRLERAAIIEVINSGKLVPIAIIVTPIIRSETPNSLEIRTAFSTSNSEPKYSPMIPPTK